ncbi:hypothetical protein GCM10022394_18200 [Zobellella aerophila]|uniref:Uncharacterized protein n=1 Tax=Zobellella aerophila TaxID=870480 RepID=A0ABP6VNL5_9GAMM
MGPHQVNDRWQRRRRRTWMIHAIPPINVISATPMVSAVSLRIFDQAWLAET